LPDCQSVEGTPLPSSLLQEQLQYMVQTLEPFALGGRPPVFCISTGILKKLKN